MSVKSLEKKVLYLWMFEVFLAFLALDVSIFLFSEFFASLDPMFFAVPIAMLLILSLYMIFRYRAWGFEVRGNHLYIRHGVVKKVESMVPYVRVQHVDTQRGVLERVFGLSRVVVYTAGSRGADVKILGLYPKNAIDLQQRLRDFAIEAGEMDAV